MKNQKPKSLGLPCAVCCALPVLPLLRLYAIPHVMATGA